MYVVVTGGSGFLGSHVAEELLRRGHEVGVLDVDPPPPEILGLTGGHFIRADLSDFASIYDGLEGADAVCHLAGVGDVYLADEEPQTAALLNVVGSANVAEAAVRHGVRKLVYASTWEVYGAPHYQPLDEAHPCNPDCPYSITKYAGERLALSYDRLKGLPVIALRLGTGFGLRMRRNAVFSLFIDKALQRLPITVHGTGEQSRQFTHALDIARAFALSVESEVRGEAINIVAEESTSIRKLAELVGRRLPTSIEHCASRAGDTSPAKVSCEKAKLLLAWEAQVSLERGLDEMIACSANKWYDSSLL